jgi:Protein of unknown function (DUF2281)
MPTLELTDEQAIDLLQQLPEDQKQRVLAQLSRSSRVGKKRKAGSAKGDILYIAPDFDAPPEDFKDYM